MKKEIKNIVESLAVGAISEVEATNELMSLIKKQEPEATKQNFVNWVLPFFPDAHIYREDELILESKNNVYFRIDDIESELDFKCKMLHWLSRPSCKGLTPYWIKWFRRGLNSYFKQNWSAEEMNNIYTKLGNGLNHKLCIQFIESDFDLSVLK